MGRHTFGLRPQDNLQVCSPRANQFSTSNSTLAGLQLLLARSESLQYVIIVPGSVWKQLAHVYIQNLTCIRMRSISQEGAVTPMWIPAFMNDCLGC